MIPFFRKIRKKMADDNKPLKYMRYAIGEILLVVIGILIALQINNWNEENNQSKKELALLVNLKKDLNTDIESLSREDSFFSKIGDITKNGINLFINAKNIEDIYSVSKLISVEWDDLNINRNTYNEMISSGNMYNIKNEMLQKHIIDYYLNAEADKYYIRQVVQEQSHLYVKTPEMNAFKFLISQLKNPLVDLNSIDTTWINNPKSPTYLAVITYLNRHQEYNIDYRSNVYNRNIIAAQKLVAKINDELENRN